MKYWWLYDSIIVIVSGFFFAFPGLVHAQIGTPQSNTNNYYQQMANPQQNTNNYYQQMANPQNPQANLPECGPNEVYNPYSPTCRPATQGATTQIKPQECMADSGLSNSVGIETALGCIPTEPQGLIAWLFRWGLALGGGVAFIFLAIGAFNLLTSQGNPEQVKAGQEFITSAVVGLMFIIFSIFLLRLIGFQILQIPGFG